MLRIARARRNEEWNMVEVVPVRRLLIRRSQINKVCTDIREWSLKLELL